MTLNDLDSKISNIVWNIPYMTLVRVLCILCLIRIITAFGNGFPMRSRFDLCDHI